MKSIQEWKEDKFFEFIGGDGGGGMDPGLLRRFLGKSQIEADPKIRQRMKSRIMDVVADYPDKKSALMAIVGSAISLLGEIPGRTTSVSKAARVFDDLGHDHGEGDEDI